MRVLEPLSAGALTLIVEELAGEMCDLEPNPAHHAEIAETFLAAVYLGVALDRAGRDRAAIQARARSFIQVLEGVIAAPTQADLIALAQRQAKARGLLTAPARRV